MKKCIRCKIVFQSDERIRCLYCDAMLRTVTKDDGERELWSTPQKAVISQIIQNRRIYGERQGELVVSNYFRIRSFHFKYCYCRNEYKMGREFKRFMIQPMTLTYILAIPWAVINFTDSLLLRLFCRGYCEKCQWKYVPKYNIVGHESMECEYNREYSAIVKDIFSGVILANEAQFKQAGEDKMSQGKRSAYYDLCRKEGYLSTVVDIAFVTFSIFLIMALLVWGFLPVAAEFIHNLD